MFTVLVPLLEFTYHRLSSWRKFALCIQSLLCMLFLFGWPPCQRSDMISMVVSQHAYDMIHYISGLFGYFNVCEIYVNLTWYLYLFMLNKFCLSLSYCLLLLISMLWHRQAIFESKGDKLSSSAECRIRTQGPRHLFASRLNADDKPTELLKIKLINLNSTARPSDQQAFSPLYLTASWFRTWIWRYTCLLLLVLMLWHRQAIFESKADKSSSSAECRIRTQGLRHLFASRLNACWQPDSMLSYCKLDP